MKLIAINIADSIDIKSIKQSFNGILITSTSTELFYKVADNKYISIFNYGVVAFSEHTKQEIDLVIDSIKSYISNKQEKSSETIDIQFSGDKDITYHNDVLTIPLKFQRNELYRIAMFDLSQSVALDYYSNLAEGLLQQIKIFTSELEQKGKITLNHKKIMKFIGKSQNTKFKIFDNLYIFDSPDITWENEKVDKIHKLLVRAFDLNARFKEIEYTLKIIDESLQIFKERSEHWLLVFLETIVIILILVEVVKSFLGH